MRELKETGIDWIGRIPIYWNLQKVKYNFSNNKKIVGVNSERYQRLALTINGVIKKSKIDNNGLQPYSFDTYQILKKNELVFKLIDLQNITTSRVGLSPYEGIVSPAYIVLKSFGNILPSYAEKFFLTLWNYQVFNALGDNGVRSSLNVGDLGGIYIPIPPFEEQKKIADFLDEKCDEIDALHKDIEEQISILEKYKKSIITEAITKGLDINNETSETGVFYMPPINSNWKLTKIGYECTKLTRFFEPEDIALICSNQGRVIKRYEDVVGKMVSEDNAMQGIKKGDIAIHGMDTWHGAIALSDYNGKITRVVHVCDSKQDKRFIVYYLQHLAYQGVYKLISNGVRGNTSDFRSWEKVKNIYISIPTINEQQKICDYLDFKCHRIEKIIKEKKKQLLVLAEYKKSLIYEYVTGKKEVQIYES